ncbi:MAG: MBL fold metallo-hydrolase [Verrucomicrobiae bacterium]|nr:MBL fold metallo-hydrolase [Verrucomicrobiae bacterium]
MKIPFWPGNLHSIRGLMGWCHLLVEGREAILIDTGLVGETLLLQGKLGVLGLGPGDVKAILLTHGHLDHAGNLAAIKRLTGARVYGHREEVAHVEGRYPYEGAARVCGYLEAVGRRVLRYESTAIDEYIAQGDELPFWGGLRVIHLPGHTKGHCGFYSPRHDLLFCGDLFASYFFNVHPPPAILNSVPDMIPGSLDRVRRMNPRHMVPQHFDFCDAALHRRRFDRMMSRRQG